MCSVLWYCLILNTEILQAKVWEGKYGNFILDLVWKNGYNYWSCSFESFNVIFTRDGVRNDEISCDIHPFDKTSIWCDWVKLDLGGSQWFQIAQLYGGKGVVYVRQDPPLALLRTTWNLSWKLNYLFFFFILILKPSKT